MYIKFKCLKDNVFTDACFLSTKPHFNIVMSPCWQLLHEPRRVVEGTASVESTTALAIPERIIRVKANFISLGTCSVTEIVIANIRRDWYGDVVVDVSAGTQ